MNLKKKRILVVILGMLILTVLLTPQMANAKSNTGNLMDIFDQKAFQGDWALFGKLNFVGKIMQLAITVLSLLGMCTKALTIIVTFIWITMRPIFNTVHEIKTSGSGGRTYLLGMDGVLKQAAKTGTGLDSIIYIILSLAPDLIIWSDYNPDFKSDKLDAEKDTVAIYFFKIFFPTSLTFLFLSMGFNGSLWKAFVMVVNGMGVIADRVVDFQLDNYIERTLSRDGSYSMEYGADGTNIGKFKESMAEDIYKEVYKRAQTLDQTQRFELGQKIAEYMDDLFGTPTVDPETKKIKGLESFIQDIKGFTGTDKDAKNLQFNVIVNNIEKLSEATNVTTISFDDLNIEPANADTMDKDTLDYYTLYVHISVNRKNVSPEVDYWGTSK